MILADKIINERKKNGWSQEELAEQLSVSRQSISKWESAQAIPDIQKIIKMAELFGVTTDYLLKDDLEPEKVVLSTDLASDGSDMQNLVRVSLEEANEYLDIEEIVVPRTANMVSLIIFGPALLIFLLAVSELPGFPVGETVMTAIGVIILLILVAIAVFVFIIDGAKTKRFEYLETSPIETLYGVTGMVKEKKKANEQAHTIMTALGVIMCILSPVPLLFVSLLGAEGYAELMSVSVLLLIICGAVNLLVRAGGMKTAYAKLLQEGDYSISEKKKSPIVSAVSSVYWILTTAIFLTWSFVTNGWDHTWIVWPIAGVIFGIVITITNVVAKNS